ncbi:hypothetical protein EVAR_103059_1 [Eumeta japonica]|uniref:Uncharacterized protein n=1 Tax=Eumeta variegata TaxID=151549 RepID=A0A4C1WR83_EUMVA|nr:hypothetical protein EVAR_103059_1 [Eumeta japonica]
MNNQLFKCCQSKSTFSEIVPLRSQPPKDKFAAAVGPTPRSDTSFDSGTIFDASVGPTGGGASSYTVSVWRHRGEIVI